MPESELTYDHSRSPQYSYQYGAGEASLLVKAAAVLGTLLCIILASQILLRPDKPKDPLAGLELDDDGAVDLGLNGHDLADLGLETDADPVVEQMLAQMRAARGEGAAEGAAEGESAAEAHD